MFILLLQCHSVVQCSVLYVQNAYCVGGALKAGLTMRVGLDYELDFPSFENSAKWNSASAKVEAPKNSHHTPK